MKIMNKGLALVACIILSHFSFAQTWISQANVPLARHHPISFSLAGKGYSITGSSGSGYTNNAYQYDPVGNSWRALPNFPGTPRSFGIGAVANGKAYMGFGNSAIGYLNDLWRYDATDSSWTQLANCGCPGRRHPAMIAIGDRLYVGLGDNGSGDLQDWWMYDINTDTWTLLANFAGPKRHHPYMFNAGGEVFAGFGHSGSVIYKDWYKLDTALGTWSAMTPFPGEARVAGTQFDWNGYGFVLSGDGDNHSYMNTGEMWRYNPTNDTWLQFPSHPGRSLWAPGSFVINNTVYLYGGYNRFTSSLQSNTWKFDLAGAVVGINDEKYSQTNVFPNPANDVLNWEYDASITDVKVFNAMGQLALYSPAEAKQLNTSSLETGLYLVQFYSESNIAKTFKVMVQH